MTNILNLPPSIVDQMGALEGPLQIGQVVFRKHTYGVWPEGYYQLRPAIWKGEVYLYLNKPGPMPELWTSLVGRMHVGVYSLNPLRTLRFLNTPVMLHDDCRVLGCMVLPVFDNEADAVHVSTIVPYGPDWLARILEAGLNN